MYLDVVTAVRRAGSGGEIEARVFFGLGLYDARLHVELSSSEFEEGSTTAV